MPNGNIFVDAFDNLENADSLDAVSTPPAVPRPQTQLNLLEGLTGNVFVDSFNRLDIQLDNEREQEEDGVLKALRFLAEVTGIPAVGRTALSLLPDVISDPVRREFKEATGLDISEATGTDKFVAGITLLGGVGVKGALSLIRGVARGAFKPLLEASPTAVRASVQQLERSIAGRAGAATVATGERELAEQVLPLSLEDAQNAIRTAIDIQRSGGDILADPAIAQISGRLFEKLGEAYRVGKIDVDILPRVMRDLNITSTDEGMLAFARLFEAAASESGRTLQLLSAFKKELGRVFRAPVDKALDDIFVEQGISRVLGLPGFTQLTNTWRASITGQLATAIRNFEVSAGLLTPVRFFDDVYSGAVSRFSGATGVPVTAADATENFISIFRVLGGGFRRGKLKHLKEGGVIFASKRADELEKALQRIDFTEATALFGTPVMDILEGGLRGTSGRIINFLQAANRTQEKIARAIVFDAGFAKRMAAIGVDPVDFWRLGYGSFSAQRRAISNALSDSVREALELTFAGAPQGRLSRWMIQGYRQFPALALVHPFPRFLANSLKFLRDHSPLGLARFMTANQRRAIVEGLLPQGALAGQAITREAVEAIGKTLTGYTMLAGAMVLRNSELAGERWYEIKVGGRTVDTRPFNPLAAYMLLAEQMRRSADPDALGPKLKVRDYAEAFVGIRRLKGTGLFILEGFSQDVANFEEGIKNTAAEIVGGFTIPFRTFKDFIATVKEDEGVFRAREVGGILGPALGNLPLIGAALQPEEPRATQPGVVGEEPPIAGIASPTFRQLTGLITRTPTPTEAALTDLDISPRPRTGDKEFDREISEVMGPLVEQRLGAIVSSGRFQRLDKVDQRRVLAGELTKIKRAAKEVALRRNAPATVERVIKELEGKSRNQIREELARMRRAGRINAELERAILRRLLR